MTIKLGGRGSVRGGRSVGRGRPILPQRGVAFVLYGLCFGCFRLSEGDLGVLWIGRGTWAGDRGHVCWVVSMTDVGKGENGHPSHTLSREREIVL